MALSIGGERQFGRIYAKQWLAAARTLSLPQDYVADRLRGLLAGFPDAFATALHEVDSPDCEHVRSRALDRLAHHCEVSLARLPAA